MMKSKCYILMMGTAISLTLMACEKDEMPRKNPNDLNGGFIPIPATIADGYFGGYSQTSTLFEGEVLHEGTSPVYERGVCYNFSGNPSVAYFTQPAGSGLGKYTCYLVGLLPGYTYYARAYAISAVGVVYGETRVIDISFPRVADGFFSGYGANGTFFEGEVLFEGVSSVHERGICYNYSGNPSVAFYRQTAGWGVGKYGCHLTGLNPGFTYYARAYAINAAGVTYGKVFEIRVP